MSDLGYCPFPGCGQPGVKRRDGEVKCFDGHWCLASEFNPPPSPKTRERTIEQYFIAAVSMSGGWTRKVKWLGVDGAPDRMAGWPAGKGREGRHGLVELKRPKGMAEAHQLREHTKLRNMGFRVDVLDTKERVDAYVKEMAA